MRPLAAQVCTDAGPTPGAGSSGPTPGPGLGLCSLLFTAELRPPAGSNAEAFTIKARAESGSAAPRGGNPGGSGGDHGR